MLISMSQKSEDTTSFSTHAYKAKGRKISSLEKVAQGQRPKSMSRVPTIPNIKANHDRKKL